MSKLDTLKSHLQSIFANEIESLESTLGELTLEVSKSNYHTVCQTLRDNHTLDFDNFIDLCVVDYLTYGQAEWVTEDATSTGFSRGCDREADVLNINKWGKPRFAVVCHFQSIDKNWRIRVKCFLNEDDLIIPSLYELWPGADWFEREAYDLFGVLFEGHPDLRRILTDYGFVGHPFRKDFPVSGHVEMRYDAKLGRVVYEPVKIEPRTLVARTIRKDNRYVKPEVPEPKEDVSNA